MGYLGARAATKDTAQVTYWTLRFMFWITGILLALMAAVTVGVFWVVARLSVLAYWKWYRREPAPYSSWSFTAVWDRLLGDDPREVFEDQARNSHAKPRPARQAAPQPIRATAPSPQPTAASRVQAPTTPSTLANPSQIVDLALPPDEAWHRLLAAMESVGKVEQMATASRALVGKARYGLNPVRIKLAVVPGTDAGSSRLEIESHGQDVWGVASKKVTERVLLAMG